MFKVGDLVHDSSYGMNGVIVDEGSNWSNLRPWTILYEDGHTDEAFDNELEVVK